MAHDKLIMEGLEFYGYHGTLAAEQELGQRFILDIELALDLRRAGETDDLAATVNYAAVYRLAAEIVQARRYRLLEAVAEAVAQAILGRFPVDAVKVRVRKPQAPLPGHFGYVAAEILRRRDGRT